MPSDRSVRCQRPVRFQYCCGCTESVIFDTPSVKNDGIQTPDPSPCRRFRSSCGDPYLDQLPPPLAPSWRVGWKGTVPILSPPKTPEKPVKEPQKQNGNKAEVVQLEEACHGCSQGNIRSQPASEGSDDGTASSATMREEEEASVKCTADTRVLRELSVNVQPRSNGVA
ncbi:hypothetical protein F4777DRAFT_595680 [Nemania sp. FL0916]|nr:hypothetical protein F4777DRAFT_595680 [Nemania sp. FL0916]